MHNMILPVWYYCNVEKKQREALIPFNDTAEMFSVSRWIEVICAQGADQGTPFVVIHISLDDTRPTE